LTFDLSPRRLLRPLQILDGDAYACGRTGRVGLEKLRRQNIVPVVGNILQLHVRVLDVLYDWAVPSKDRFDFDAIPIEARPAHIALEDEGRLCWRSREGAKQRTAGRLPYLGCHGDRHHWGVAAANILLPIST